MSNIITIKFVTSIDAINAYISYGYLIPEQLIDASSSQKSKRADIDNFFKLLHEDYVPYIIPNFNLSNFCVITIGLDGPVVYVAKSADMLVSAMTPPKIIEQIKKLNPGTYLCSLSEFELQIIQEISSDGYVNTHIKDKIDMNKCTNSNCANSSDKHSNFAEIREDFVGCTRRKAEIAEYLQLEDCEFTDIWCLNREGGLIKLNTSLGIDLLKQIIYHTDGLARTNELTECLFGESHLRYTYPSIVNLIDIFDKVQQSNILHAYPKIYNYYSHDDTEYYSTQLDSFQRKTTVFFTEIMSDNLENVRQTISNFITNFKHQICVELTIVYHWLYNRSTERRQIYETFSEHPYIQLIRELHQTFCNQKKCLNLNSEYICYHLTAKPVLTEYNRTIRLLFDAVKYRHQLFNVFGQHKDNNHYPFKIFFENIFIMEHLLNYSVSN